MKSKTIFSKKRRKQQRKDNQILIVDETIGRQIKFYYAKIDF